MSVYNFTPMVTNSQNYPFVSWENGFTEEEIQKIIDYCETIPKQESTVAGHTTTEHEISDERIRRSEVSWIENTQEIFWLYDRLAYIVKKINGKFYNFDLTGFSEHFQYTVYNEQDSGHYDWHLDLTGNKDNVDTTPRKLSLVLQLSDPDEYEGGELQTFTSPNGAAVVKQKGLVVLFPSWTLHRVTPVTKGTRKTLVVWVTGPQFK
jgi:PKHD-type hydroxylase